MSKCDIPRLEESQRRLVVDTLRQATTPALGGQADWAGLPIGLEKTGWQIRTYHFTVTLEHEDALEINVIKLLMYSLNVLCQSGILEQRADGRCCAIRVLVSDLSINRRAHIDVREVRLRLVADTEEEGVASEADGSSLPLASVVSTLKAEPSERGRRCRVMSGLRPAARKDGALTGRT
jgi:hypothetical protein